MYKISVSISFDSVTVENMYEYINMLKDCKADRVFFCGPGEIHTKNCLLYKKYEQLAEIINTFKIEGFETGVWVSSFGHGVALMTENVSDGKNEYVQMEGIRGDKGVYANCPLDENFTDAYMQGITKVAMLNPDFIMLDDDFRINTRKYFFGCFCKLHLKRYYEIVGEETPREELEKLILTGGKNKYRDAYLQLAREALITFAKKLRNTVDKTNPNIRVGACTATEIWDLSGTTPIEIAKTLAGNTKPFTRLCGAPYWDKYDMIFPLELERVQQKWCENSGVEIFAEGDTYPRPRYNVSSKILELFEYGIIANGGFDGTLSYLFPYLQKPSYETGYVERFVNNAKTKKKISEMFKDKISTGISVLNFHSKIDDYDFPDEITDKIKSLLRNSSYPASGALLSANSIATTYEKSEYPVFIAGENAKYIQKEDLKNGAILDIVAAEILQSLGVDTGLVSIEKIQPMAEYFEEYDGEIRNICKEGYCKIVCSEKAEVSSVFLPDNTPASYYYENDKGNKFFVLAYDMFGAGLYSHTKDYMNNYYRQAQLVEMVKCLCGKKLPVMCSKNPNLYTLASKNKDGEMSVLFLNVFPDDVIKPVIELDKKYEKVECVNCNGTLNGDKLFLSDIKAFDVVAFTVG